MSRRPSWTTAAVTILALLAGCSSSDETVVDVFAASSLTDAFAELEADFEADNPGIDVRLNLAGSNALQRQILDGAEADVFAPADVDLLEPLADRATDPPVVYATNRLTLVVPRGGQARVQAPDDVADDGALLARCASGVPCGDAADSWLAASGLSVGRSTDEPDVRSVLTKVVRGEVDAGLVYVTDAAASDEVIEIPLPGAPTVSYGMVVLTDDAAAARFADYVRSPRAASMLVALGFGGP